MVENLDTGKRTRTTLQATALLMMLSVLLLGAGRRAGAPRPGEVVGAAGAPMPAPAGFLAAPSRAQGADGGAIPQSSERIAALSEVLSGGERSGGSERSPRDSAARADMPTGVSPAPSEGSVPRAVSAEVVARLERGGEEYWLLSVQPEGRILRAAVSSGTAPAAAPAPPSAPYLEQTDGRFELVTPARRYRVVEPPWEGSRAAVVGESP